MGARGVSAMTPINTTANAIVIAECLRRAGCATPLGRLDPREGETGRTPRTRWTGRTAGVGATDEVLSTATPRAEDADSSTEGAEATGAIPGFSPVFSPLASATPARTLRRSSTSSRRISARASSSRRAAASQRVRWIRARRVSVGTSYTAEAWYSDRTRFAVSSNRSLDRKTAEASVNHATLSFDGTFSSDILESLLQPDEMGRSPSRLRMLHRLYSGCGTVFAEFSADSIRRATGDLCANFGGGNYTPTKRRSRSVRLPGTPARKGLRSQTPTQECPRHDAAM